MDEMMRGQRGWRDLTVLGDKMNKFTGMIEGLLWSPRSGDKSDQVDDWAFEKGPHSDFSGPTSGCTACVAIIRENQLVVANAGDSSCVVSRNGQESKLSVVCEKELERCLAPSTAGGEGCDNMTMILVQFKKATSSDDKPSASEAELI